MTPRRFCNVTRISLINAEERTVTKPGAEGVALAAE